MIHKKYRLLKDLPNTKAGAIVEPNTYGIPVTTEQAKFSNWPLFYSEGGSVMNEFIPLSYLRNTDWFEEIKEQSTDQLEAFVNCMPGVEWKTDSIVHFVWGITPVVGLISSSPYKKHLKIIPCKVDDDIGAGKGVSVFINFPIN